MTDLEQCVEQALAEIRPLLKADGGNIALVEITGNLVVKVKLKGACEGCPFGSITMKSVVEAAIRKVAPEVKEVEAI
ncbi:MAG: NifU family protein [Prevotellaceae bacterium]|jgi:Fe-S cluster biogenesis protein NfuA|nr:NifU family protein [Prevotellaceae bacterium]